MKNFLLSIVNTIKAFDIKEAFAMDNLFECWLDSDLNSLSLELVIGETRTGAEFTVKLYDVDNAKSCVVLTGDYTGLTALKAELKTLLHDLNTKTETELTALVTPEETQALSNLDAVKKVIDVFVTTKHNKATFAWCAESDEYKAFADSKADAIQEITEAMILDGIIDPVLNIIDGDYNPEPPKTLSKSARNGLHNHIDGYSYSEKALQHAASIAKAHNNIEAVAGFNLLKNGYSIELETRCNLHAFVNQLAQPVSTLIDNGDINNVPEREKLSINKSFNDHSLTITHHKGYNVITDYRGQEVTRVYGSSSERITQEGLIRDCLQEGRKNDPFKCEALKVFNALAIGTRFQLVFPGTAFNAVIECDKASATQYTILSSGAVCDFMNFWITATLYTNLLFDTLSLRSEDVSKYLVDDGDQFMARFDSEDNRQYLTVKAKLVNHRYECRVYRVIDGVKQETKEFTVYDASRFIQYVKNIVIDFGPTPPTTPPTDTGFFNIDTLNTLLGNPLTDALENKGFYKAQLTGTTDNVIKLNVSKKDGDYVASLFWHSDNRLHKQIDIVRVTLDNTIAAIVEAVIKWSNSEVIKPACEVMHDHGLTCIDKIITDAEGREVCDLRKCGGVLAYRATKNLIRDALVTGRGEQLQITDLAPGSIIVRGDNRHTVTVNDTITHSEKATKFIHVQLTSKYNMSFKTGQSNWLISKTLERINSGEWRIVLLTKTIDNNGAGLRTSVKRIGDRFDLRVINNEDEKTVIAGKYPIQKASELTTIPVNALAKLADETK